MIGDLRGSMPDITGTGTSQKVKKIFGFIWETGRHILEMMLGTLMAMAMYFQESRFFFKWQFRHVTVVL